MRSGPPEIAPDIIRLEQEILVREIAWTRALGQAAGAILVLGLVVNVVIRVAIALGFGP